MHQKITNNQNTNNLSTFFTAYSDASEVNIPSRFTNDLGYSEYLTGEVEIEFWRPVINRPHKPMVTFAIPDRNDHIS